PGTTHQPPELARAEDGKEHVGDPTVGEVLVSHIQVPAEGAGHEALQHPPGAPAVAPVEPEVVDVNYQLSTRTQDAVGTAEGGKAVSVSLDHSQGAEHAHGVVDCVARHQVG